MPESGTAVVGAGVATEGLAELAGESVAPGPPAVGAGEEAAGAEGDVATWPAPVQPPNAKARTIATTTVRAGLRLRVTPRP